MRDIERIRSALSFIPPDSPETLLRMGTAIKDGLGDEGFSFWNEWVLGGPRATRWRRDRAHPADRRGRCDRGGACRP
jgi:hypothetical protein